MKSPITGPPIDDDLPNESQSHRPNNHPPNDKTIFKGLENRKMFILENTKTAGKMSKVYFGLFSA